MKKPGKIAYKKVLLISGLVALTAFIPFIYVKKQADDQRPVFDVVGYSIKTTLCQENDEMTFDGPFGNIDFELQNAGLRVVASKFFRDKILDYLKDMNKKGAWIQSTDEEGNTVFRRADFDTQVPKIDYEISGHFDVICCQDQKGKQTIVFRGTITDVATGKVVAFPVVQRCCEKRLQGVKIIGKPPSLWEKLFTGYSRQIEVERDLFDVVQQEAIQEVTKEAKRIHDSFLAHNRVETALEKQLVCSLPTSVTTIKPAIIKTKTDSSSKKQSCKDYCSSLEMEVATGSITDGFKKQFSPPEICPILKTNIGQSFTIDVLYDKASSCACRKISPITSNFIPPNEGCWQTRETPTYLENHWSHEYTSFVCKTAKPKVTLTQCN